MKSYRKTRKNKRSSRRNKRGGFFSSKVASSAECDINNLSTLSKDMGDGQDPLVKMRNNYQKCCPKTFGMKNSSPYCKQLDLNYKAQAQYKSDTEGYYGDETDVAKIKQTMNQPVPAYTPLVNPASAPKKAWYQFWGGKKTRKHRKVHRRK